MKALYLLVLILCFGARLEATAALQSISVPDTLILTPYKKTIKGAKQTVRIYNGQGYNTYLIFYDGLSRPLQKHALEASPAGNDVIAFIKYDCMGRDDSVTFMPYVKNGGGTLRANPVSEQNTFYRRNMGYTSDGGYAFSRKKYAKTPYDMVELTDAPGRFHNSQSSIGHPMTHTIRQNIPSGKNNPYLDKVNKYGIIDDSLLICKGQYPMGQLLVKESSFKNTDTGRTVTLEYTNQQGQKIAQGEFINDSLLRLNYYVYDDFGNQRYLIPSVEDKRISASTFAKAYAPSELKYSVYHGYDKYGDRILVRNPDQAPVNYVYDAKHRMILSQDGNQRTKHQWTYCEYDEYDRLLRKSTVYANADPALVRSWLEELYGPDAQALIESRFTGKRLLEQFQYTGYDEPVYKKLQLSGTSLPSVSVIDSYTRFQIPSYLAYEIILPYLAIARRSDNPGAVCYQKTAVLSPDPTDTLTYIEKAFYYDDKGRMIQTVIRNHLKGITRITTKYDKVGNVLATHESKQASATKRPDVKIVNNTYDKFGRLLCQRTTINDSPEAIVRYDYDELGRCSGTICGDSILTTRYTYDIAGRQTIQDNEAFRMELRYENPSWTKEAKPNYGGMVTECSWLNKKIPGGPAHTYAYNYTPYGQLAGVVHYEGTVRKDTYVERGITYDENDNLLTLQRFENASLIANCNYVYQGNALVLMVDRGKGNQFNYDLNGNVVYDGRKYCNYRYNSLNLLEQATDPTNNVLAEYSYLADGTKLAVRDKAGNGYTYLGSLIYQSNGGRLSLENTLFNGGSILKTSSGYEVVYHVTDYLGSIRAVVDSSGKVLEYNNYYPFGERWQQTGPLFAGNRYRFNGKELQVTGQLGLLDYGARMYDPALARWQGCDPAMQMANPFVFSGNNPVVYVDKDGKFFWYIMAALAGAYFGGSAANNNWNPVKWDWGSGKTWGGFFGGAIQGTIGAAMMGYGLSALSGSGTTMLGQTLRTMVFYTNSAKIFATGASLINNFDNAMDIIRGNYLYDGDNFGDMIRMSLSRSLWERPQQAFGYIYSHGRNGFRKGIDVSYFHGATVVNKANTSEHKGVTMGNMINGWNIYAENSSMLYHEYGHVIQSRYFGLSYLFSVGIPSAIVAGKDNGYWTEVMANRFSRDYFGQDVWDQTAGNLFDRETGNPIYPTTY
ncbi:MAG: RHS repeat domain-containing protein [Alistipes sp.]|uniref:RHS repeat domain-containing protein n=1 Tax=Alistipes TaxID=239759 RepID=UPI003992FACF|nr:DUF6443 domain-containing protein [Rikenellaceae bacterium]